MSRKSPKVCRPEAYHCFAAQLPRLDSTDGLISAAVAVSMHALEEVTPEVVLNQLAELGERVASRVQHGSFEAKWAHLHEVLFEEEGFQGNHDQYYSPANSYLPIVLGSRRGIPISLGLIYKGVAEVVGLAVEGVNAPGHFLVCICHDDQRTFVDPFHGGQVLTRGEAIERIGKVLGPLPFEADREALLKRATHHAWLARMLANLELLFEATQRDNDREAMRELQAVLPESCA